MVLTACHHGLTLTCQIADQLAALQHCGAVGGAIASHFSYFPTWEHMWHKTDFLQRYERIAEEACGKERLVGYD